MEEPTSLELLIGSVYGTYPKARLACLSRLNSFDSVDWMVARNIDLTENMIFPAELQADCNSLFLESAYKAIENAVSELRFSSLLSISRDPVIQKPIRDELNRRQLISVAGAVANADEPEINELIEIALWFRTEDHTRIIAAERVVILMGDHVPKSLDPADDLFIEPAMFKRLVFVLSEDLPIFVGVDPLERHRAVTILQKSIRTYALSGCFRELSAISSDNNAPEFIRAEAVRSLEEAATNVINRAIIRMDSEALLSLLAVVRSHWVSKEIKFEAAEMLSDHANATAEVHFLTIVRESCPPAFKRITRDKGLAALAKIVEDEKRQKTTSV